MELILVRHAEPVEAHSATEAEADPGLSERGRIQAGRVASWLTAARIDRVISSPARRAVETATPTASGAGVEVVVDDRLRDANEDPRHYVPIEVDRERDREGYLERVESYRSSPRLSGIVTRVNESLEEWAARSRGERIAVFCHGSVINVYAAGVLGLSSLAFLEAGYASAHRFMISSKGIRSVQSLNETAYLSL